MSLVLLFALGLAHAADLDRGARIYRTSCSACHGAERAGDGPAAAAIKPAPTNLADPAWWEGRDLDSVRIVIRAGKPGTAMMAFGQLSDDDIDNVIAWLQSEAQVAPQPPDESAPSADDGGDAPADQP